MGPLFDNNRWILETDRNRIYLRLLELPPEIMIIYVRLTGCSSYDGDERKFNSILMSFGMSDS